MRSMFTRVVLLLVVGVVACRDAKGKQEAAKADPVGSAGSGSAVAVGSAGSGSAAVAVGSGSGSGSGSAATDDYTPAEFKTGNSRWKDAVIYLDGKPIDFLTFGELPITLKPTWIKDKVSAEKRPGTNDLPWRWAQQRFYKFTDLLKALGVDVRKVKEMHVYASKFGESIIATAKDLQSPAAEKFMFRFGGDILGKPIPAVPPHFANGGHPDKTTSVMIYVDKTPPKFDPVEDKFVLDGQPIMGVPYYGEPLRGGVRIYLDDRLATIVKRQELDVKTAKKQPDGDLLWSFADFLKTKGVDTSKVVEGWVIRDERRAEKLSRPELLAVWFSASSQAHGGLFLGDKKIKANAIALHTRAIQADELPVVLPEEE